MNTIKKSNHRYKLYSFIFAAVMMCSCIKLCDLLGLILSDERGIFICSISFLVELIIYSALSIFILNRVNILEKQTSPSQLRRLVATLIAGFIFFSAPVFLQQSQLPISYKIQPEFNLLIGLLSIFTVVTFWGFSFVYKRQTYGSLLKVLWLLWVPVSLSSEIFLVARTILFKG